MIEWQWRWSVKALLNRWASIWRIKGPCYRVGVARGRRLGGYWGVVWMTVKPAERRARTESWSGNDYEIEEQQYSWSRGIGRVGHDMRSQVLAGMDHTGAPPSHSSAHTRVGRPWSECLWSDPLTSGCGCELALGLWSQPATSTQHMLC